MVPIRVVQVTPPVGRQTTVERERILDAFRRWGYLQAQLDPLGFLKPLAVAGVERHGTPQDAPRQFYCGTIGADFMHLAERERRDWISQGIERPAPEVDRKRILERLGGAGLFRAGLQGGLS